MLHISLFSGIGGFDLAAEWMGWKNIVSCEINDFGNKVLEYYWPDAYHHRDIHTLNYQLKMTNLQNDTAKNGVQMTLFSQEASLASPTALQENDLEKKMSATCGPKCLELYQRLNRPTLWAKTLAGYLVGTGDWYSTRCALTWRLKGTRSQFSFFQLRVSMLRTNESGFGLLLTPTTREEPQDLEKFKKRMEKYPNGTIMPNLATQVFAMLPTPKTQDSRHALRDRGKSNLGEVISQYGQDNGMGSQLNPRFVLEMMGFPSDWTELPFQNGEAKQLKQEGTQ